MTSTTLARLAVFLGAVEFVFRALLRTKSDWLSDLAAPYSSARLWIAGADPYNQFVVLSTWLASGGGDPSVNAPGSGVPSVYPPPTLLLVSPFALLRWPDAVHLFVLLGLILYATVIYTLVRLGWQRHHRLADIANDPLALFFVAVALGFAPIHTAIHSLNVVLFSTCAAILAIAVSVRSKRDFEISAQARGVGASKADLWVVVGVTAAILLKPTTGIFLLPWLARERRWRLILTVCGLCGIITSASLGPLVAHQGMAWLTDYRQGVSALFTHGGNADVSSANFENTDRIDLQLVFYAISGDRTIAAAAAALLYFVLLAVFLGRSGWGQGSNIRSGTSSSVGLSFLVAAGCLELGLLPSYTRVYAAVVLLPLVLWCFTHLQFSSARWLLLLLSDFLLNTSAIARKLADALGVTSHPHRLWDATIGGHTCWILLAIGLLLPLAVRQQTRWAQDHSTGLASVV